MRKELKPIAAAMLSILCDAKASRIERIECAKVLLSCYGQLVPDVDEAFLSVRQLVQLRSLKQEIVERVLKRKDARKRQNRRTYLRRQIKKLEATKPQQTQQGEHGQIN